MAYNLHKAVLSAPVPGQSLTAAPKNLPMEHPPQFVTLKDSMGFLLNQILEPEHMFEFFNLMKRGITIEEITRVLIFSGFTLGKWTPDLAMLMYKPTMMMLIALCHRAGLKDVNVLMKHRIHNQQLNSIKNYMVVQKTVDDNKTQKDLLQSKPQPPPVESKGLGFMANPGVA